MDSVGPRDLIPIDTLDPTASSVVPLEEGGITDVPTDIPTGEIEVISETTPTQTNGLPDPVIVGETDSSPAVLEVTPDPGPSGPAPSRPPTVSTSMYNNPSFDAAVLSAQLPGEFSVTDQVVVSHGLVGEYIGGLPGEEIPLDTFSEISGFGELEVEEQPLISTPRSGLRDRLSQNFRNIRRRFYNRRIPQVRVPSSPFISRPGTLVEFEYNNPAYEPDVSIEFERNLDEVQQAPDLNFRDIIRLGRPETNLTDEGHVRVSRLGTKGTIVTRSGLVIGGQTHYFTDLSTIVGEEIELPTHYTPMNEAAIIHVDSTGTNIDTMETSFTLLENGVQTVNIEDNALLDDLSEDFSNVRLLLSNGTDIFEGPELETPSLNRTIGDHGVNVNYPTYPNNSGTGSEPEQPSIGPFRPEKRPYPLGPSIALNINGYSFEFIIDPYLLKRKRKKYGFFS